MWKILGQSRRENYSLRDVRNSARYCNTNSRNHNLLAQVAKQEITTPPTTD